MTEETNTPTELTANDALGSGLRLGIQAALGQDGFENDLRDIYDTFGWPDTDAFDEEAYLALYLRNAYARTVVDKPAFSTWRDSPEIVDTDTENSEFEDGIDALQQTHDVWSYCERADRVAGIGEHGVLVIGFDDVVGDHDQWATDAREANISGLDDINTFKPAHQAQVDDVEYGDMDSERWGLPEYYIVDWNDDIDDETEGELGGARIHWTRVINVPSTRLLDDETLARPRMEPVLNNLIDIQKTQGSAAEQSYRGADYGLHLNVDPEKVNPEQASDDIGEEVERYYHELQPWLRTVGTEVEQLGGEMQDPSPIVESNLDAIAAQTGIPKQELRGNQQGEISGAEQDAKSYFGMISERREQYATPYIVKSLLDRLVDLGLLDQPTQGEYDVRWPDLTETSTEEQSTIDSNRAGVIANVPSLVGDRALAYLKDGPDAIELEEQQVANAEDVDTSVDESDPAVKREFSKIMGNEPVNDLDLTPPEAVQEAAQRALDMAEEHGRDIAMSDTGWSRAEQLAAGEELSPADIADGSDGMANWWARHAETSLVNGAIGNELKREEGTEPHQDPSYVAGLGWGGAPGARWATKKKGQIVEAREEATESPSANANRYGEGDTVSTPQGVGVVVDVLTEPDEEAEIEATSDSPTYAVVVEDGRVGVEFYKASDLKVTDSLEDIDVDNPEEDISEEIVANVGYVERLTAKMRGNQPGRFNWPDTWQKSDTPARLIALKAWANMGGSVDGCIREMRGNVTRPGAFCADFADRLYGTDFWRGDSWAPGD